VPYQAFATADGWLIVSVGNDVQWHRFCGAIERPDLRDDPRFATNAQRVLWRDTLCHTLQDILLTRTSGEWLSLLEAADVPAGPVNTVGRALNSPQVAAREMVQEVAHPTLGPLRMVASPLKLELTPPTIRRHPPLLGEHTEEVLGEVLGLDSEALAELRRNGAAL
jgi:crotonobetainyl-CoA:carnitine CoA-transferase CaiB-like acyl-CoA transferase